MGAGMLLNQAAVTIVTAVSVTHLTLSCVSATLIRLPAFEAEGHASGAEPSPQAPGERLVSFLVSFMYLTLRPSPSNTAL